MYEPMQIIAKVVLKSYLAEGIVILMRSCVGVVKHNTVGQGEVLKPQMAKCHPVLQNKQNKSR